MATILSFKPSARSAQGSAAASHGVPAEIVFFPGVRYERWNEPVKPQKKKRTRRDKINLKD
jgi:hypothetical protein